MFFHLTQKCRNKLNNNYLKHDNNIKETKCKRGTKNTYRTYEGGGERKRDGELSWSQKLGREKAQFNFNLTVREKNLNQTLCYYHYFLRKDTLLLLLLLLGLLLLWSSQFFFIIIIKEFK